MKDQAELLRDEEQEKQAIRQYFGDTRSGFFVEVGANEPTSPESQTWHLEQIGWRGVLIEPIPDLAQSARRLRPRSTVVECACVEHDDSREMTLLIPLQGESPVTGHASLRANIDEHNYRRFQRIAVRTATLTTVLEQAGAGQIDLLSIDVEGAELEVLQGLDFARYRPRLILLEDKHLYLAKHRLLRSRGYKLVRRLNRNGWYIPVEHPAPAEPLRNRLRLWKRMYLSIWFKKLRYALRHKTFEPFRQI